MRESVLDNDIKDGFAKQESFLAKGLADIKSMIAQQAGSSGQAPPIQPRQQGQWVQVFQMLSHSSNNNIQRTSQQQGGFRMLGNKN